MTREELQTKVESLCKAYPAGEIMRAIDTYTQEQIVKEVNNIKTRLYGFQGMDIEKRRAIASKGGQRAHQLGVAHQWTPEEAKIAGRIGGRKTAARYEP